MSLNDSNLTKSYLHPGFTETQLQCQLLPREHVRVGRALERALQLLQLERGEGGARLLLLGAGVAAVGVAAGLLGLGGGGGGG